MSDVQRTGISVAPKTGQCDKPVSPTSVSNITAETFNKILMTVSIAKVESDKIIIKSI
jgi:hypothetical protein